MFSFEYKTMDKGQNPSNPCYVRLSESLRLEPHLKCSGITLLTVIVYLFIKSCYITPKLVTELGAVDSSGQWLAPFDVLCATGRVVKRLQSRHIKNKARYLREIYFCIYVRFSVNVRRFSYFRDYTCNLADGQIPSMGRVPLAEKHICRPDVQGDSKSIM
jgi:hypothetical protein